MGLELPEIRIVTQQLQQLTGKTLSTVTLTKSCNNIIKLGMCNLNVRQEEIINKKIISIYSKGKWVFIEFENNKVLLLGEMLGKLILSDSTDKIPDKYCILFNFEDSQFLTFQSSLYAFIAVYNKNEIATHKYAGSFGISPDEKEFTREYFFQVLLRNNKKALKALLGLQNEISGLGNVYINDILYESKLHPKKKVLEMNDTEKERLFSAITEITKMAIELHGSTDEVDLFDVPGKYTRLMDKNSAGKECKRCNALIVKHNILGSSSYFCPNCQKISN